jgi:hypothetical protein
MSDEPREITQTEREASPIYQQAKRAALEVAVSRLLAEWARDFTGIGVRLPPHALPVLAARLVALLEEREALARAAGERNEA